MAFGPTQRASSTLKTKKFSPYLVALLTATACSSADEGGASTACSACATGSSSPTPMTDLPGEVPAEVPGSGGTGASSSEGTELPNAPSGAAGTAGMTDAGGSAGSDGTGGSEASGGTGGAEPTIDPEPDPVFRDPFDPEAEVMTAASTSGNNESPTWVPELNGFVFYPANKRPHLHLWRVGETESEEWFDLGEGHPTHYHGGFVYAGVRTDNPRIIRIDVNTKLSETVSVGGGFSKPQDMDRFSDGSIFFSNWPDGENSGVFRLHPDGSVEKVLSSDNVNALQFSPDCKRIYTSHGDAVTVRDVSADGSLSGERSFYSKQGVNGVGIDSQGNLLVGGSNTVDAVNSDGEKVGELNVGATAINFAYGGDDGKLLFITTNGGGAKWTRMRVRGAECNGL